MEAAVVSTTYVVQSTCWTEPELSFLPEWWPLHSNLNAFMTGVYLIRRCMNDRPRPLLS